MLSSSQGKCYLRSGHLCPVVKRLERAVNSIGQDLSPLCNKGKREPFIIFTWCFFFSSTAVFIYLFGKCLLLKLLLSDTISKSRMKFIRNVGNELCSGRWVSLNV